MPGDPFRKVASGEPLSIPAAAYNAWNDLVRNPRRDPLGSGAISVPGPTQTLVRIQNDTSANLARFNVVGLGAPVLTPSAAPDTFAEHLVIRGVVPAEETHFGRWGVLAEPIAVGAIGRAVLDGITFVKINPSGDADYEGHRRVDAGNSVAALVGNARGAGIVIWRAGGTGEQWALVRIAAPAPETDVDLCDKLNELDGYSSGATQYLRHVGSACAQWVTPSECP